MIKKYKHTAILSAISFKKLRKLAKNNDLINIIHYEKTYNGHMKTVIVTPLSQEEILNIIGFKPD